MAKTKRAKNLNFPYFFFWVSIAILASQVIGLVYTKSQFQIENKIDLLDILSLTITLILAILISMVFDKNKSDHRVLKDIFINRISNIEKLLIEFDRLVNLPRVQMTDVTYQSKKISMSFSLLVKNLRSSTIYNGNVSNDVNPDKIKEDLRDFIKEFTEDSNYEINIEESESFCVYHKAFLKRQSTGFTKQFNQLLKLQILINNA
ncbi:hypothetical protein MASR1M107_05160 [Ignavibacteriales bacterium]